MNVVTDPFPHFVEQNWVDPGLLVGAIRELPQPDDVRWQWFGNEHEAKYAGDARMWGPGTRRYFDALADRGDELAKAFDLPELHMEVVGGGYHLIPPGGHLDIHTDFSRSPHTGRYRWLNVLTFLNHYWDDEGGHLELWDDEGPQVEIAPEFGTTVAFVTSSRSWHGHPKPAQRWRASLAAYFFADEEPPGFVEQSTVWHPNGGRR